MRILFYLFRFPGWGGIETVTEIIGNQLTERGYEVFILSHEAQDRVSLLAKTGKYFQVPDQKHILSAANLSYAEQLIRERHIDIVIYQDCYVPTEKIAFRMKKAGAFLVVFEHNTPNYTQKALSQIPKSTPIHTIYRKWSHPNKIRQSAERHLQLLREADQYIVLAKSYIEELRNLCGWKATEPYADKLCYINNPIPERSKPFDSSQKDNAVLFVGQINHQKRVHLMLDVWEHINGRFPDWRLQIVGDGVLREQIQAMVQSRNLARVELFGYQNPEDYYRRAKLFWMTSAFEGWPMTLLESMRAGCVPIAMNSFSSAADIIEDHLNGRLIPDGDLESFVSASAQLMEDETLRANLAENALKKTEQFSVDHIMESWIRLLYEFERSNHMD